MNDERYEISMRVELPYPHACFATVAFNVTERTVTDLLSKVRNPGDFTVYPNGPADGRLGIAGPAWLAGERTFLPDPYGG